MFKDVLPDLARATPESNLSPDRLTRHHLTRIDSWLERFPFDNVVALTKAVSSLRSSAVQV